jgi:metallo-beta-lactamase class B
MPPLRCVARAAALLLPAAAPAGAQRPDTAAYTAAECPPCAEWNAPQQPFRIHGDAWYVGTRGLSAVLLTSPAGHVLVDAGLPESAPLILRNVRALGFRPEDIRVIVNSHAHYDHAGGIAAVQRASGARVLLGEWSAPVVRAGRTSADDPQFAIHLAYPPAARVEAIAYGDTVRVGPIRLVPHRTAGHTPGGTSWTWRSCEGEGAAARCVDVVYADSQTPVSADGFLFSRGDAYPTAVADFERGFATLESLPCDVLLTPHPGASGMFERLPVRKDAALRVDGGACRRYAASARRALAERLAREGRGR